MKLLLSFLLFLASNAFATTWIVRSDGGTPANCTGQTDAAYVAGMISKACALAHPFYVLPPNIDGNDVGRPALIKGGDTLLIHAGQYQMGLPVGASTYGSCNTNWPWDCHMQAVPSGTSAQHTVIKGDGSALTQLWGSGGAGLVLNLTGSNYVDVSGIEITDHSNCIQNHVSASIKCQANGLWAANGIQNTDQKNDNIPSSNVTLTDLNIHGLAKYGVLAGNLSNWTVINVKINANGFGGWSTDLAPAYSVSSGTNIFTNVEFANNGCTENFPASSIYACWGQQTGGYGDGFGASSSSDKGVWNFTNVSVHDNTQDGLDFLHADPSAVITFDTVNAYNNAGNQLKGNGSVTIKNSTVNGHCSAFVGRDSMVGTNSGGGSTSGDQCRALGDAVVLGQSTGHTTAIQNSTILSEGNCIITVPDSGVGDATSKLTISNSILIGTKAWIRNDGTLSCLYYWNISNNTPVFANNAIYGVKNGDCPAGSICTDPQLVDETLTGFNPALKSTSPLVGKGIGANAGTVITPPVCPAQCVPKVVYTLNSNGHLDVSAACQ